MENNEIPYEEKLIGHIIKFYFEYAPSDIKIFALITHSVVVSNDEKILYYGFDLKKNQNIAIHNFSRYETDSLLKGFKTPVGNLKLIMELLTL